MKKAQIPMIEMISVIIILIIAFSILFPGFFYRSRWGDAMIMLKGRDLILTIDRIGKLYEFSFNSQLLKNFIDKVIPEKDLISWSETQGTIKSKITVACNCTVEQIGDLISWIGRIRINDRDIDVDILQSNLDAIQQSDVLLIWGYKPLSEYKTKFLDYLSKENGIVEIMDLKSSTQVDITQKEIFGLRWEGKDPRDRIEYLQFRKKPDDTKDITYYPYKYFYNVPFPFKTISSTGSISGCQPNPPTGNISFNKTTYKFYICQSDSSVYFDTNGDGTIDTLVQVNKSFNISGYNFTLSYVDDNKKIGVSFKPDYHFADFLSTKKDVPADPRGKAWGVWYEAQVYPGDDNKNRILIKADKVYTNGLEIPAVILNSTQVGRVAWVADFTDKEVGDDEKLLLTSLLLWSSNKKSKELILGELKLGFLTSYINTVNKDMFEIYQFNLGLGYPF